MSYPNRFALALGAPLDVYDQELERPAWPYVKCLECEHEQEEHDEDHRCHVPGCTCGMNKA